MDGATTSDFEDNEWCVARERRVERGLERSRDYLRREAKER